MIRDRGGIAIVVMTVAALGAVAMIAVGSITALYGARIHASTAADAAALAAAVGTYPPAGAGDPVKEARHLALVNGAVLKECDCALDYSMDARVVTVIVEMKVPVPLFGVMPISAGARAEFDPSLWLGR
jgi:hypothetical protein